MLYMTPSGSSYLAMPEDADSREEPVLLFVFFYSFNLFFAVLRGYSLCLNAEATIDATERSRAGFYTGREEKLLYTHISVHDRR